MQVHGVKSGIVGASNGGCDAFDINRSLAEGIIELAQDFSGTSPAYLALGIITLQKTGRHKDTGYHDALDLLSNLEI